MPDAGLADRTSASILDDIRRRIRVAVDAAVPMGDAVGLLNFPNHRNAGDSAIWLGAGDVLRTRPADVTYTCAWSSFDRRAFERAVPDGPVVLNGGGNFGDLYPAGQQALREHVLATVRDRPVVQLPQSIYFDDPENRDRVARLVEEHGDVVLLCRDEASLELALRHFACRALACPDLAFWTGPFERPAPPEVDVLWLARSDQERRFGPPDPAPDLEVVDWLHPLPGEPPWPADLRWPYERVQRTIGRRTTALPARGLPQPARPLADRLAAPAFDALAAGWVARGVRLLARGRVVVTDRLHAHVLAFLTGIPSVVLDNTYGKVHGVIETTTAGSPLTHRCRSVPDALALARELAAEMRP